MDVVLPESAAGYCQQSTDKLPVAIAANMITEQFKYSAINSTYVMCRSLGEWRHVTVIACEKKHLQHLTDLVTQQGEIGYPHLGGSLRQKDRLVSADR